MDNCPQEPCEHALQAPPSEVEYGGLPPTIAALPRLWNSKSGGAAPSRIFLTSDRPR